VNFAGNKWWTFAGSPGIESGEDSMRSLLPYLLVVLLVGPLFFWNLGTAPLRIWDESRLAANALAMNADGDLLVTHFHGEPDLWNTKPPLLIWAQVACLKLIGPSDLAVRLPSAVAGVLTCILLLAFVRLYLKDDTFGLLAALVLATSPGFMGFHGARTADYDVPMTLLTTAACLAFFLHIETGRTRYLYGFVIALTLGILTKGVGAVLFLPALALYAVIRRRVGTLLRNRHLYVGLAIVVVCVGFYYGLRELRTPGYLAKVSGNELGGRYLTVIEGHGEHPLFFLTNLWHERLPFWTALVPLGMVVGFLRPETPRSIVTRFATLLVLSFFLIISLGKTKCAWYDIPAYPFLAIIVAAFATWVLDRLGGRVPIFRKLWLSVVVLGLFLAVPYRGAIAAAKNPENNRGFYRMGYLFKEALAGQQDLDGVGVLLDGYSPQNEFYIRLLQDRGVDVARRDWRQLEPGDRVLVQPGTIADGLAETYECEEIWQSGKLTIFEVVSRRP
jgi:4-amino-4-deoxy-L-arabinose transferase-like glycosyltransferase